jgi:putative heme degradation protein
VASFEERLERHLHAATERVERLREQAEDIAGQLAAAEEELERLSIGGEVYRMVMMEDPGLAERPAPRVSGSASPIGILLIPERGGRVSLTDLPVDYRDILEILARAEGPLRARDVAAAVGLGESSLKAEGMRSKLNRLAQRGWASKTAEGRFTVTAEVRAQVNAGT